MPTFSKYLDQDPTYDNLSGQYSISSNQIRIESITHLHYCYGCIRCVLCRPGCLTIVFDYSDKQINNPNGASVNLNFFLSTKPVWCTPLDKLYKYSLYVDGSKICVDSLFLKTCISFLGGVCSQNQVRHFSRLIIRLSDW